MLNFDFLQKGLGPVYPRHVFDFKENVSHDIFIKWPNFNIWLPLLLEMLGDIRTVIFVSQFVKL